MKEKWKDIQDYEGLYQVSNLGRIQSHAYKNEWTIIKPIKTTIGYLKIQLHKKGVVKTMLLHRIVAHAFIKNDSKSPCVEHIDTVKTNNCVGNLRWCTHSQNINNPITIKRLSDAHKGNKSYFFGKFGKEHNRAKAIIAYRDNAIVREYGSIVCAATDLGITRQAISKVLRGVNKTANGLTFKYK